MLVYIHADNSGSSRIFRLGYPPFPLASPLLFLLPLPLPFTAITVRIFEARNLYSGEGFCHEKLVKIRVPDIDRWYFPFGKHVLMELQTVKHGI